MTELAIRPDELEVLPTSEDAAKTLQALDFEPEEADRPFPATIPQGEALAAIAKNRDLYLGQIASVSNLDGANANVLSGTPPQRRGGILSRDDALPGFQRYAEDKAFINEARQIDADATIYSLKAHASINPINYAQEPEALPEPALDFILDHNLVDDVKTVVQPDAGTESSAEVGTLPPFLSSSDANTANLALFANADIKDKLIKWFGEDAYNATVKKTQAIMNINIADSQPGSNAVVRQYNLLRVGAEPDDTLPMINPQYVRSVGDTVAEPPIADVTREPLFFNPTEARVVLSALQQYAFSAGDHHGNNVASLELLRRFAPRNRDLYEAMLQQSGVPLGGPAAPEYPLPVK